MKMLRNCALATTAMSVMVLSMTANAIGLKAVNLKPQFESGQTLRYQIESGNSVTQSFGAGMETSQNITIAFKVINANEDGTELTATFEKIKMSTSGAMDLAFDSATPADQDTGNELASALRPIVGKSLSIKMDSDGNITELTGDKGLIPAGQMGGFAQAIVGADQNRQLFIQILMPSGTKTSASTGDKWTNKNVIPVEPMGTLTISTDHTLKGVKAENATIMMDGTITFEKGAQVPETMPIDLTDASYNGQYVWNHESGSLTSLKVDGLIKLKAGQDAMVMEIENKTTTTIKRVD